MLLKMTVPVATDIAQTANAVQCRYAAQDHLSLVFIGWLGQPLAGAFPV